MLKFASLWLVSKLLKWKKNRKFPSWNKFSWVWAPALILKCWRLGSSVGFFVCFCWASWVPTIADAVSCRVSAENSLLDGYGFVLRALCRSNHMDTSSFCHSGLGTSPYVHCPCSLLSFHPPILPSIRPTWITYLFCSWHCCRTTQQDPSCISWAQQIPCLISG